MNSDNIDKIREQMKEITTDGYKIHNFIPYKTPIKELVPPKVNETDLNIVKSNINRTIRDKDKKRKIMVIKVDKWEEEAENIDILKNDLFNVVKNENKYLEWKKMCLEDKIKIMEEYLEKANKNDIPYTEEIKVKILEMVKDNKILIKKEIVFDKINKKILDIPIVKYVDEEFIIEDVKKISIKKKNLTHVNKLIKKK